MHIKLPMLMLFTFSKDVFSKGNRSSTLPRMIWNKGVTNLLEELRDKWKRQYSNVKENWRKTVGV